MQVSEKCGIVERNGPNRLRCLSLWGLLDMSGLGHTYTKIRKKVIMRYMRKTITMPSWKKLGFGSSGFNRATAGEWSKGEIMIIRNGSASKLSLKPRRSHVYAAVCYTSTSTNPQPEWSWKLLANRRMTKHQTKASNHVHHQVLQARSENEHCVVLPGQQSSASPRADFCGRWKLRKCV